MNSDLHLQIRKGDTDWSNVIKDMAIIELLDEQHHIIASVKVMLYINSNCDALICPQNNMGTNTIELYVAR